MTESPMTQKPFEARPSEDLEQEELLEGQTSPREESGTGSRQAQGLATGYEGATNSQYGNNPNEENNNGANSPRTEVHQATDDDGETRPLISRPMVVYTETGIDISWRCLCQYINTKKAKASVIIFIIVVISICILIGLWTGILLNWDTVTQRTTLYPGSMVQLISSPFFWHDKAEISEENSSDGDKVRAQLYCGFDCESKVKENETFSSSQKYLPFTHPDRVDDSLYAVYLLKGSQLLFKTTVDPSSDLEHATKLCRFRTQESVMVLIAARDMKTIMEAEKKGECDDISKSSNVFENTTIKSTVGNDGYYFYAISALSSGNKSVNIFFWYELYTKYYNKSDFELHECSVSDDQCIFNGLTKIKSIHHFCFLAYVPLPPTMDTTKYTFVTTLSVPSGILVLLTIGSLILILAVVTILLVCYCSHKRCFHRTRQ